MESFRGCSYSSNQKYIQNCFWDFWIVVFSMTVVYSLVCVRGGTVHGKKSNCTVLRTRFGTH